MLPGCEVQMGLPCGEWCAWLGEQCVWRDVERFGGSLREFDPVELRFPRLP